MNRLKGWIISIVGLIIVYGLLNLVLGGAQDLWHKGDTDKLQVIETYLKNSKLEIDALEQSLAESGTELESKETELNSYKENGDTDLYNAGVDDFNALLSSYKTDLQKYNSLITTYNQKIEEGNELIKKTGSRWYVVPIPRRASKSTK